MTRGKPRVEVHHDPHFPDRDGRFPVYVWSHDGSSGDVIGRFRTRAFAVDFALTWAEDNDCEVDL